MEETLEERTASRRAAHDQSAPKGPERSAETYLENAELFLKRRDFAAAEPLLREALALRPDDPDVLNKLGSSIWEQGRPAEAEPLFRQAHEARPDNVDFLNHLGLACWDQGRPEEALEHYRRALALDPTAVVTRMNLGVVLSDLGRFDESLEHLRGAARDWPDHVDVLQNLGMTLARLERWDEAIAFYDRALEVRPDYAEVHRNRAYAWLHRGDYQRGWPEHEWRLGCRRHVGCQFNRPRWRGEALGGRTIVLHCEQGYGDTIQFVRYAALVKRQGGTVLLLCQRRLLRLLARCAGVDLTFDGSSFWPDCHVHASLLSLPAIFGTTLENVPARTPYLAHDPMALDRWRAIMDEALDQCAEEGGPRDGASSRPFQGPGTTGRPFLIGVAWQGRPAHQNDRWRSFSLDQFAPIARLPGVRLISLQTDHGLDQLQGGRAPFPVVELPDRRPREFHDTAAIMGRLDLVIGPDSAVAHLAGALGVPVWTALSTLPEWRWMSERSDSPWYPTMRLFRQTKLGDWSGVFERMAEALRRELARRAASAA